jgi:hypothetical protein
MHRSSTPFFVLFYATVIGSACGAKVEVSSDSVTGGGAGGGGQAGAPTGSGASGGEAEHLQHVWSKAFGDDGFQLVFGLDVAPSSDIVLCGDFNGNVDFGGGNLSSGPKSDLLLARLEGTGSNVWSAGFGDASLSFCDVATDAAGDVFVGGELTGVLSLGGPALVSAGSIDIFLAKLGPAGEHLWSKRFGDDSQQNHPAVAVDSTGAVVIAGSFEGTLNFGGTDLVSQGADIYVAKFDAAGSHLWSIRVGDGAWQSVLDVATDQQNDIYLVGNFSGTLDFGAPFTANSGSMDAFLVKLDADANYKWGKQFGDSESEGATVVSVAPSGNVAIAGSFNGSIDLGGGTVPDAGYSFFVAEYDPEGNPLWSTTHGQLEAAVIQGIDHMATGGVVVAGTYQGTLDFGGVSLPNQGPDSDDVFLAVLDAQGTPLSVKSYGSAGPDHLTGVVVDDEGSVVLVTIVEGPSDFGGGQLAFTGASDIVVAKYNP